MTTGTHAGWRTRRWSPALVCVIAYPAALLAGAGCVIALSPLHPIVAVLIANIAATLAIFVVATLLDNASVYDPYWSLAPPGALVWWIWGNGGLDTVREAIVLALVLAWSVRLTWNCMRRWRDMTREDFRYADLKRRFPRAYPLVNLFGIELFPTLLVFAGCLPLHFVSLSQRPPGLFDVLAIAVMGGAIALEATADRQLRRFLNRADTEGEICREGLWAWSRHPNYLGEIGFWWGVWLFGIAAGPAPVWAIAGPVAMTALFVFVSVPLMEARKRLRHPGYDEEVASIPVLCPLHRITTR